MSSELASAESNIENPEQLVGQLREEVAKAKQEAAYFKKLYNEVLEKFVRLERGFREATSERSCVLAEQLTLSIVGIAMNQSGAAKAEPAEQPGGPAAPEPNPPQSSGSSPTNPPKPKKPRARPTGRKALPEHLPREVITFLPEEVQRNGTDAYILIGVESSERIDERPHSFVVVRVERPKYVRKADGQQVADALVVVNSQGEVQRTEFAAPAMQTGQFGTESQAGTGETQADEPAIEAQPALVGGTEKLMRKEPSPILIAPPYEGPIPKGLAGPGLLANTIVRRWDDHLPLHRQERIYARMGYPLARSTISQWHDALSVLVEPLVDAMFADARRQPILFTDATLVKMRARLRCKTIYYFVLIAPERHVLFHFTPKHNNAAIDEILGDFRGHLVADGHTIYDHLHREEWVIEVACWAHVRRYFVRAATSEPDRASHALREINTLFSLEHNWRSKPPDDKRLARQISSQPIVDRLFEWVSSQLELVFEGSQIYKAFQYMLNQREGLHRFLTDGRLPLHNNHSENELRRYAVGRKNWLFICSKDGGVANARFSSLLASCRMHGIDPTEYLRDIFCLLPLGWPEDRLLELAPVNWKATSLRPDVLALLESDPMRPFSMKSP